MISKRSLYIRKALQDDAGCSLEFFKDSERIDHKVSKPRSQNPNGIIIYVYVNRLRRTRRIVDARYRSSVNSATSADAATARRYGDALPGCAETLCGSANDLLATYARERGTPAREKKVSQDINLKDTNLLENSRDINLNVYTSFQESKDPFACQARARVGPPRDTAVHRLALRRLGGGTTGKRRARKRRRRTRRTKLPGESERRLENKTQESFSPKFLSEKSRGICKAPFLTRRTKACTRKAQDYSTKLVSVVGHRLLLLVMLHCLHAFVGCTVCIAHLAPEQMTASNRVLTLIQLTVASSMGIFMFFIFGLARNQPLYHAIARPLRRAFSSSPIDHGKSSSRAEYTLF